MIPSRITSLSLLSLGSRARLGHCAEGREVCAAGGSQLSEGVVFSLQVPRLPLCGCCVTAEMHRAARACTGALLSSARIVTVSSSESQPESRTSFNLCPDKRGSCCSCQHCVSPEIWLQLQICQGKTFGSSSWAAKWVFVLFIMNK